MGKNRGRMGEYREFEKVWMVREFWLVYGVGSSMGGIWKEWGKVGEEWGSVLESGGDVDDAGKYGEVWKSVWGESRDCGGKGVGMCGEVWESMGGSHTLFYIYPTPLSTPSTLTRHLFPHLHTHPTPLPHTPTLT